MARVLVTRAQPEADRTAGRVRALGHDLLVLPLTTIVPLADGLAGLTGALDRAAPDQTILIATSARAVEITEKHGLFPALSAYRWAVVGDRAGDHLARLGATLAVPPAQDGAGLITALKGPCATLDFIYLAAADRRPALEQAFPAMVTYSVYQAEAMERSEGAAMAALRADPPDFGLVYSARSARLLAEAMGPSDALGGTTWLCLSSDVEEALKAAFGPSITTRVAERPEENQLLSLLP